MRLRKIPIGHNFYLWRDEDDPGDYIVVRCHGAFRGGSVLRSLVHSFGLPTKKITLPRHMSAHFLCPEGMSAGVWPDTHQYCLSHDRYVEYEIVDGGKEISDYTLAKDEGLIRHSPETMIQTNRSVIRRGDQRSIVRKFDIVGVRNRTFNLEVHLSELINSLPLNYAYKGMICFFVEMTSLNLRNRG